MICGAFVLFDYAKQFSKMENSPISKTLLFLPIAFELGNRLFGLSADLSLLSLDVPKSIGFVAWLMLNNKLVEIEQTLGSINYLKLMISSIVLNIGCLALLNILFLSESTPTLPTITTFTSMGFFYAIIPPYKGRVRF